MGECQSPDAQQSSSKLKATCVPDGAAKGGGGSRGEVNVEAVRGSFWRDRRLLVHTNNNDGFNCGCLGCMSDGSHHWCQLVIDAGMLGVRR